MTFLELEKKCKKRRLLKIAKIILLLLVAAAGAVWGWFYYKNTCNVLKNPKQNTTAGKKKIISKKNRLSKTEKHPNKTPQKEEKKEEKSKPPKLKLILDLNTAKPEVKKEVKKTVKQSVKQKPDKEHKQHSAKTDIQKPKSLIQTKTLPSYETCISLAKYNLKNSNFQEALKWAKNANIQNNKDPLSWIISAKALYNMGKKEKAINILKIYLKYNKNPEVEKLLKSMQND